MTTTTNWLIATSVLAGGGLVTVTVVVGYLWFAKRFLGHFGLQKKRLLTPNELDFYKRLLEAVSPTWTVLVQVAMGALLDTTLKASHPKYFEVRGKFSQKICDFVLCDPRTMAPVLIIELDDVMHDFSKDKVRDTVAAKAGYQTLRFWSRKKPTVQELKQHIECELALNSRHTLN
jgi:very-short-patch-repair endonuclease